MSIASAIQNAQQRVADAYTAISNKGGTLPATQNLANMPTAIGSISTGGMIDSLTITPTTSQQTISASGGVDGYSPITVNAVTSSIDANITAGNIKSGVSILGVNGSVTELNGTTLSVTPTTSAQSLTPTSPYNGYTSVSVSAVTSSIDANITAGNIKDGVTILGVTGNYSGGGGGGYTELPSYQVVNGVASKRRGALTGTEFSNITSVGVGGLRYAFYNCTGLTGHLNLSSLTSIGLYGMQQAFANCYGITSVNLSSLTSVDLSGIDGAFSNCTGLTSVDLSSLTSIGSSGMQQVFYGCTSLTGLDLPALTSVGAFCFQYTFFNCTNLTDVYFNSLKTTSFANVNAFSYMLFSTGTSVTHTIHFPSNLESTIQGLTGYPTFGGTSGSVVLSFDLDPTE